MKSKLKHVKRLNASITNWIIKFEKLGYNFDFKKVSDKDFLCIQNNKRFPKESLIIDAVKLGRNKHHSLETIETDTGDKGLLLTEIF
ncbi:hypothetical protein [Pedobacter sp. MW01-1-1]|uniref:hypothetical protein n=1 Tax=Pedobacter sp. MW01-1-1 TaxID=3383027 RepID=UPI003FEEB65D